jgi:DNA-binding CsgD family transcriptional regulator
MNLRVTSDKRTTPIDAPPAPGTLPDPNAPPPRDLDVSRFESAEGEMIVLAFPIDELAPSEALTPAEHEVVAAIEAGKSNAEIARERGTSARTVANQVGSIFKKLKVGSRAELVATRAVLSGGSRER